MRTLGLEWMARGAGLAIGVGLAVETLDGDITDVLDQSLPDAQGERGPRLIAAVRDAPAMCRRVVVASLEAAP
jgi:hypothetical protein